MKEGTGDSEVVAAGYLVFSPCPATVYDLPGTFGLGSSYTGLPTKLWNPAFTGTALAAGAPSQRTSGSSCSTVASFLMTPSDGGPQVPLDRWVLVAIR